MEPGLSQDYYARVYETQCIINRSLLSAEEFSRLTESEKKNLMIAIENIYTQAYNVARLVIAAQERNETFDDKDCFNLKSVIGEES